MAEWAVQVSDETGTLDLSLVVTLERAALVVLEAEGVDAIDLSIALLDDLSISRLNRDFLSHDGPTDVISFPLHQPGLPRVGDIYIGVEQALRQAREAGVALDEELIRLTIHGTLHVLGWEHPDGEDRTRSEMFRRQEELLRLVER